MSSPSSALDAAIRAIRGESNVNAVSSAFDDARLATVIALAPTAQRSISLVAALRSGLPSLVPPQFIPVAALSDAIQQVIGTSAGAPILAAWASIAPPEWGRDRAATLIHAVQNGRCDPGVAAALIGPCDQSAALLHDAQQIAVAIRRWGQALPDEPTAWMHTLSERDRRRLLAIIQRNPPAIVECLPWLSPETAPVETVVKGNIGAALNAFAEASLTARTQHADLLHHLIDHARPEHVWGLTRLACVMDSDAIWSCVIALSEKSDDAAGLVVALTPWNDLPKDVQEVVIAMNPAVAAARGRCDVMTQNISDKAATFFFAAVEPRVWDELDPSTQRQWRTALPRIAAYLAVRSLGMRPEFLEIAEMDDNLVRTAKQYIRNAAALRWALLPGVLRNLLPDQAHAFIAALPTLPPDPGAFFAIASGQADSSMTMHPHTALSTPARLACAVALQRSGDRTEPIRSHCAALQDALREWTWDDVDSIMPLLNADASDMCKPNLAALVQRLTTLGRQAALRQALVQLVSLPPKIAVPTCVALAHVGTAHAPDVAEAIANALREHGDVFMALTDALENNLGAELLPLPEDAAMADALRSFARHDPLSARRLAHELRMKNLREGRQADDDDWCAAEDDLDEPEDDLDEPEDDLDEPEDDLDEAEILEDDTDADAAIRQSDDIVRRVLEAERRAREAERHRAALSADDAERRAARPNQRVIEAARRAAEAELRAAEAERRRAALSANNADLCAANPKQRAAEARVHAAEANLRASEAYVCAAALRGIESDLHAAEHVLREAAFQFEKADLRAVQPALRVAECALHRAAVVRRAEAGLGDENDLHVAEVNLRAAESDLRTAALQFDESDLRAAEAELSRLALFAGRVLSHVSTAVLRVAVSAVRVATSVLRATEVQAEIEAEERETRPSSHGDRKPTYKHSVARRFRRRR